MKILILSITAILQSLTIRYQPLYENGGLTNNLDHITLFRAMARLQAIAPNDSILTIIDMQKPSSDKRLFVIDVKKQQLLHHSHVAHGQASGKLFAAKFSNKIGSFCTSTGLYRTGETYWGRNGYSLRLDGLDVGVNHNARTRGIVIHPSEYASPDYLLYNGILGRSQGCPALPPEQSRQIIETIKNGTLLYIAN